MQILNPCLVVMTGMAAAGKTTLSRGITKAVANAVYLARDTALWSLMYVLPEDINSLPSFEEYVQNDGLLPDGVQKVPTFCGEMTKLLRRTGLYRRHIMHQSYLILWCIGADQLALGKVVVVDQFLTRQITDGTLKRFLEEESFKGYRNRVIHVVADVEACWNRTIKRDAAHSKEEQILRQELTQSRESFEKEFETRYPRHPKGIEDIDHLILDTSGKSVEACVEECIKYITT